MKPLRIALIALFLGPLAIAQAPDSLDAERYAPFEVGNEWHFEDWRPPHNETNPPPPAELRGYDTYKVVSDTSIAGRPCFEVHRKRVSLSGNAALTGTEFIRFDEETGNVVSCTEEATSLEFYFASPCPLDADVGTVIDCGGILLEVQVGGGPGVLNIGNDEVEVTYRSFVPMGLESVFMVASDIGFVKYGYWYDEMRIVFARVGGEEYGTPAPLSSNAPPTEVEALSLTVHPNPSSGRATVSFSLDASQEVTMEVFDLLGRRVQQENPGMTLAGDHQATLDLHGLPAGLYIVRLSGDSGASATARLTRLDGT